MGKGTTIRPFRKGRRASGNGFVTVLTGVDRDRFVHECLRTNTVAIITEDLQIVRGIRVDNDVMQRITFPNSALGRGSTVFWVNDRYKGIPVVTSVLASDNEFDDKQEFTRSLGRSTDTASARVAVDGKTGTVYVAATNFDGPAKLNIEVNGGDGTELNLNVKGNIKVSASGDASINARNITHNKGGHPVVRGDVLKTAAETEKQALTTLIEAIQNAPTSPQPDGGLVFKQAIVAALTSIVRGDFDDINSERSFVE